MNEQIEIRKSDHWFAQQKRHRAAALQNLAEIVALPKSRQRGGMRQPYAALTCVHCQAPPFLDLGAWSFSGAPDIRSAFDEGGWNLEPGIS